MHEIFNQYKFGPLLIETIEKPEELEKLDYTHNIDFWVTVNGKKFTGTGFTVENIRYQMAKDDDFNNAFIARGLIIFKDYKIETIAAGLMKLYGDGTFTLYLIESA